MQTRLPRGLMTMRQANRVSGPPSLISPVGNSDSFDTGAQARSEEFERHGVPRLEVPAAVPSQCARAAAREADCVQRSAFDHAVASEITAPTNRSSSRSVVYGCGVTRTASANGL